MTATTTTYLQKFQPLLSMPRETVPQLTAEETRKSLRWAAESLQLECIEISELVPTFLLLPAAAPDALLFATWHAEAVPVEPAAVEGAERLALSATLAGMARAGGAKVGLVVTPGATQGSLVLGQALREHRTRLRTKAVLWPRIIAQAPRRRRVFLGARGRVVLGIWDASANPYRLRDRLVEELKKEAYGPRPLDFELLHKLGDNRGALDFLEEAMDGEQVPPGQGEEALRRALFEPRGQVVAPQVRHPDRPQAWVILDVTENADADEILVRARGYAEGARIEMADGFPWDRIGIHHPAIQAQIKLSKEVSEGPEIWPSAPWLSPSGVFSRALGVPLAEWGLPIHPGIAVRFPKPEDLEGLATEVDGLLRAVAEE